MSGTRRRSVFAARLVSSASQGEQPRVLEDLRHAILAGDEPPGTLIPIDAVADFFGVSQIPVREALKVLTSEGLIDHIPHVGYSVAKLTYAEFRELYVVRQALEAAALREAVRRATEVDDAEVVAAHRAFDASLRSGDLRLCHAESRHFHMALIGPARIHRLVHMYEAAWNMTEPARPMTRVGEGERATLHEDHSRMLSAFLARDADALVTESAQHFEHLLGAIELFSDDPDVFVPER